MMRMGVGYPRACLLAQGGVSYHTSRAWLAEGLANPDGPLGAFARDVTRVKADKSAKLERVLMDAAEGGDTKVSQWLLERREPEEYSTRTRVDVAVPAPEDERPKAMSTADLEAMLEEQEE